MPKWLHVLKREVEAARCVRRWSLVDAKYCLEELQKNSLRLNTDLLTRSLNNFRATNKNHEVTSQVVQNGEPGGVRHECDREKSLISDVHNIDSFAFGPRNDGRGGTPVVCGKFALGFRQKHSRHSPNLQLPRCQHCLCGRIRLGLGMGS